MSVQLSDPRELRVESVVVNRADRAHAGVRVGHKRRLHVTDLVDRARLSDVTVVRAAEEGIVTPGSKSQVGTVHRSHRR